MTKKENGPRKLTRGERLMKQMGLPIEMTEEFGRQLFFSIPREERKELMRILSKRTQTRRNSRRNPDNK